MPVLLLDTLAQVRCGDGEKDRAHFDQWCCFGGVVVSLVVLVGGRGFCRGGGRGLYVGGWLIVVVVKGTDSVFTRLARYALNLPSSSYFLVCGVVVTLVIGGKRTVSRKGLSRLLR